MDMSSLLGFSRQEDGKNETETSFGYVSHLDRRCIPLL